MYLKSMLLIKGSSILEVATVDFDSHKVVENNELKARIANQYPYKEWLITTKWT